MFLNLYVLSDSQAMPVWSNDTFFVVSDYPFTGTLNPLQSSVSHLYSSYVSLKKLLATSPHGIAGDSRDIVTGSLVPFSFSATLIRWFFQRCLTSVIGSQLPRSFV